MTGSWRVLFSELSKRDVSLHTRTGSGIQMSIMSLILFIIHGDCKSLQRVSCTVHLCTVIHFMSG